MFATSTKTATFLPNWVLSYSFGATVPIGTAPGLAGPPRAGPGRCERASHERTGILESDGIQPGPLGRIVRASRFDRCAALVGGRSDDLLEEGFRHPVRIGVGGDDEEIDDADVTAGGDGRADRKDR